MTRAAGSLDSPTIGTTIMQDHVAHREMLARREAARVATAAAEVKEAATKAGGEAAFLDTAAFSSFLAEDRARWERTVAALKAR